MDLEFVMKESLSEFTFSEFAFPFFLDQTVLPTLPFLLSSFHTLDLRILVH